MKMVSLTALAALFACPAFADPIPLVGGHIPFEQYDTVDFQMESAAAGTLVYYNAENKSSNEGDWSFTDGLATCHVRISFTATDAEQATVHCDAPYYAEPKAATVSDGAEFTFIVMFLGG